MGMGWCRAQGWVDGQSGLAHREGDTGAAGPVWSRSVEAGKREGGLVDPKGEGGGLGCRLGPRLNCQGGVSEGWRYRPSLKLLVVLLCTRFFRAYMKTSYTLEMDTPAKQANANADFSQLPPPSAGPLPAMGRKLMRVHCPLHDMANTQQAVGEMAATP